MAWSDNNPLLIHVHGKLGKKVVFKEYGSKTVLSKYPDMSKVKPSPPQKAKRKKFKNAVAFAKSILLDPKKKAAYQKKLKPYQTVFHLAISEYMKSGK